MLLHEPDEDLVVGEGFGGEAGGETVLVRGDHHHARHTVESVLGRAAYEAATAGARRSHYDHRLALVGHTTAQLAGQLRGFVEGDGAAP